MAAGAAVVLTILLMSAAMFNSPIFQHRTVAVNEEVVMEHFIGSSRNSCCRKSYRNVCKQERTTF